MNPSHVGCVETGHHVFIDGVHRYRTSKLKSCILQNTLHCVWLWKEKNSERIDLFFKRTHLDYRHSQTSAAVWTCGHTEHVPRHDCFLTLQSFYFKYLNYRDYCVVSSRELLLQTDHPSDGSRLKRSLGAFIPCKNSQRKEVTSPPPFRFSSSVAVSPRRPPT